jgi:hypothetical protein
VKIARCPTCNYPHEHNPNVEIVICHKCEKAFQAEGGRIVPLERIAEMRVSNYMSRGREKMTVVTEEPLRQGRIVQVNKQGLLIVEDNEGQRFAMTFDKVVGYCGETAQEFGLKKGAEMRFSATDGIIESAELVKKGESQ